MAIVLLRCRGWEVERISSRQALGGGRLLALEVAARAWPAPAPPLPHPTAKNPLTVLECVVEGGGVSVLAMFKPNTGWRFIATKSEGFGDSEWPSSSWESDSFGSLQDALRLLDVYDWWSFRPLVVADQFREEIVASIEGRTRAHPSSSLLVGWQKAPPSRGPRAAKKSRRT
jgi:hypothetical protein